MLWVVLGVGWWNEVTFIFFIILVGGIEVDFVIHLWDRKYKCQNDFVAKIVPHSLFP